MNSPPRILTATCRALLCGSGVRCVKSFVLVATFLVTMLVVNKLLELSPLPLDKQQSRTRVMYSPRYIGENNDHPTDGVKYQDGANNNNISDFSIDQFLVDPTNISPRKFASMEQPENARNPTTVFKKPLLHGEHKGVYTKLIVWHMIPRYRKHGPDRIMTCGDYKCVTSTNRSKMAEADAVIVDAFLLSRNRIKDKPVKTSPNQAFVFFSREPWTGYSSRFPQSWDSAFNWTLTYQTNSDIHIPYGQLIFNGEPKNKPDWSAIMKKKTQSVFWLVSNCNARSKRMEYVEELKKYIDIHIVGKCGKRTCGPNIADWRKDDVRPCYEKSMFYLSFESVYCKDYVTEKFFRTFNYPIIPIVRGRANYSNFSPKDLYIDTADFTSPKELAGYLKYLQKNETAYLGYLKRRSQYIIGGDWLKTCEVCKFSHNLEKHRRSYPSITSWIDPCE